MLRNVSLIKRFLLAALGGLLLGASFPSLNLALLAWFAFVPLFAALEGGTRRQRFFTGYVFGTAFFSMTLYWLTNVSVPGAIGLILLIALVPASFSLYRLTGRVADIIVVPSLWVVTEFARAYLLSGFPWALVGYSQYLNLKIIQIADLTGAYGISFIILAVNVCLYTLIFTKSRDKTLQVAGCVCMLVCAFFYGYRILGQTYYAKPVTVAVVQGNIPQDMKWDPQYKVSIADTYKALSLEAGLKQPDIIIWPETAIPGLLEGDDRIMDRIRSVAEGSGAYLLTGAIKEQGDKYYNSAYLFSPQGELTGSYDKTHLVPFGEYVPLQRFFPWIRNLVDKPIGDFAPGKGLNMLRIRCATIEHDDGHIMHEIQFYDLGVLICFEDIFPDIARQFTARGALFLVNITNDGWFGKTSAPFEHVQASVFRAVENRVPVVRAANTGVSCIIDQKGMIVSAVKKGREETFVPGFTVREIYPVARRTVYTTYGDGFSGLCCMIALIALLRRQIS